MTTWRLRSAVASAGPAASGPLTGQELDDDVHRSRRRTTPLLPTTGAETLVPLVVAGITTYADLDVVASAPALTAVAARVAVALPRYPTAPGALGDHEREPRGRLAAGLAGIAGCGPVAPR